MKSKTPKAPRANPKPLRGEAAWIAEKKRVAERNDAARARGAAERAAFEQGRADRELAQARMEDSNLPEQPHP